MDVAARRLNGHGVSSTLLAEVADEMCVSRAALYYYIEDRDDLVFQVYRRSCELLARRLDEAANVRGSATEILIAFLRTALNPDEPEIAALTEIGMLPDAQREIVEGLYGGIVARLAELLREGAARGEIRACDFDVAARTVISIIHWLPTNLTWTKSEHGLATAARHALVAGIGDVLVNGWIANRSLRLDPPPVNLEPLVAKKVAAFDREAMVEAKREAILLTASRLFNRKGLAVTSMDEIAAALGATKRTLYQYVGDKETIVSACVSRAIAIYDYIGRACSAQAAGGEVGASSLVQLYRAQAVAALRPDISPIQVSIGRSGIADADKAMIAAAIGSGSELVRQEFAALRRDGTMRDAHLQGVLLLANAGRAWLARGLPANDERSAEVVAKDLVNLQVYGLKAI